MKILNKYNSYKNSEVVWLRDIPEHWKIVKSKRILVEASIKGFPDEELLAATQTKGVIPKSMYGKTTVTATKNFETLKLVEKGDFVISLRSFEGGIEYAHFRGIISPAYTILKPQEGVVHKYYRYLLKSKKYISGLTLLVTGIREGQNIDTGKFKDSYLPLPPKPEQTAIANFLDYKLEKIDRFIAKKKQLIKLLNEQKAAIINQAVTKGLNPNAKMKPSGIEWLGDIPESWAQTKLKSIGFLYGGLSGKSGKDFKIDNHPNNKYYIPFTNIANNSIINNNQLDTVIFYENEKQNEVLKNDLLFLMSSETYDDIGKSALMKYDINEVYLNSFCKGFRIVSKHINSSFLNFLLMANVYRTQLIIEARGFTRINLKIQKVKDLTFFYPNSIEEQTKIVTYIETETIKIDKTIATIKKEISLVEEYKTALIAEAVTGKIDVRDFEIPQIEMPLAMVAEEAANYNKKN